MNLTVKQLRAFVAVAEQESFSLAAKRLHLTPGAISLVIRELEAEIDFLLFDRTTRRVTLSRAGRAFLPSAERALREMQAATLAAHDVRNRASGVIQVAAPLVISSSLLPPVIAAYHTRQPDVMVRPVDCSTHNLAAMVADDRVDLAVGPGRPASDNVSQTKLQDCAWAAWCTPNHTLAKRRRLTWDMLLEESVIVAGMDPNAVIDEAYHSRPDEGRLAPAYAVENMTTALGIASAGLVSALAPSYVGTMAGRMGLVMKRLHDPVISRELCLYVSSRRSATTAVASFVAFLQAQLGGENANGVREQPVSAGGILKKKRQ